MADLTFKDSRPGRERVQDQFRTLIRKARDVFGEMETERFNRRPPDGGWSAAECVEHLNATARLYIPALTDAIGDARARGITGGDGPGRTWIGRAICWTQEPPARFRMKTFEEIMPGVEQLEPAEALDEFEALHEELIVRINEAGDLDLKKIKVRSVLDARLKLSLGDWFAFLAAHARRHLWQAHRAATL